MILTMDGIYKMSNEDLYITLDEVKWHVVQKGSFREVHPLCPKHHIRLSLYTNNEYRCSMTCAECQAPYNFKREYTKQKNYILNKLDSKIFKKMKFINLDDEAIPIAESKASSKDNKYFVTALLTESKVGQRLIVYAGEKGKKGKTQIFIEPEIKRLAFDQNDTHPSDVFLKLEGTFEDGATVLMKQKKLRS